MFESIDMSLVDWSRGQFALTAMFHWVFVPLTLGLSFIVAFMHTIYFRTGQEEWKKMTKFWMKLFGINFAIGVATGIILEFEFGTNWSNYSWFVGDIFGTPLAVEGIFAFFLESTFIAIMFFGWNKVSKRFHLAASWLTAFGANLSAVWILVANSWMQNPVGTVFNPLTARNEMTSFWDVALSETAVIKFLHTITSSFLLASIFVIGVSAWFLLKNREVLFARRSTIIAGVFGVLAALVTILTGDSSARDIARTQPMKLAAIEGLFDGQTRAPLLAIGALRRDATKMPDGNEKFIFKIGFPGVLSYMVHLDTDGFVPGISDLVYGNEEQGILSYEERIERGSVAIQTLKEMKRAKDRGDEVTYAAMAEKFSDPKWVEDYFQHFGFGYFKKADLDDLIPNVKLNFYSFHIMVILGVHFLILSAIALWLAMRNRWGNHKWLLWIALLSIPLPWIASQAGWVVAELGRQPWVVYELMPTIAAVTRLDAGAVQLTFWIFTLTFSALFIAEIKIMLSQIKKGPGGH
ncbi:MAG: cytochrome ubiquinol oxidase subunit I [Bacteroidales bacterium]|nr:cytochrome ubiquinol oxidase subunit I [Bacteroidales bacterium]MBN2699434.1 cytochrome ubiquinol oxidase subunit I [Bacteroidales bacterium]